MNPADPEIVFRIGLLHLRQSRAREAMENFRKTEQMMPDHPGLPEALEQVKRLLIQ